MKIIFMGTPDFSVGTLEALVEAGHEVVLAVTQPDKPKGRGKEMQFTPVKECAMKHGIPVFQPRRVREPECIEVKQDQESLSVGLWNFGVDRISNPKVQLKEAWDELICDWGNARLEGNTVLLETMPSFNCVCFTLKKH